ncbi:Ribonucleoside-diphosphate reductase beta chain (plasmid) [Borrelia nietonii YOR]|uniref:Ribonucleoside-diphosphate reductase subunit beta n=2 Tax=Borrelia TaxID=138 RepID=W5SBB7_9SPIR|nr:MULTISPECIES: class 1b ribonucleoside-diphosphate reductase subunit beta [Borrelia]AHH03998.1 Ribonucleoside-diphosphate reductase beta chain [Borrelia nietonii YOR]AHH14564.1 Ribonucleoside-diphosphate reductase beta chain [Borrelia hermsii MTW]UPA09833.1 class 1b ribonucleoside-diphosphate reductase subunit beta [Borrelia nietonii YOR]
MKQNREAINWNRLNNSYTKMFWDQNIRQFWVDEEIPISDDKLIWNTLDGEERDVYEKILGGLTLLDTEQGSVGMPRLALAIDNLDYKPVLGFMGAMEHMHAKSYSSIFSSLSNIDRIDHIFGWVKTYRNFQDKLDLILGKYNSIHDRMSLYKALCTSVFLETFLFYSGFFYPLYLAGQGKMVNSGEIINLILRDESVHGVFVGLLAQEEFNKMTFKEQAFAQREATLILERLYYLESAYTKDLYSSIGLEGAVDVFVRYNADKALMNLGFDSAFNIRDIDVNPLVLNGLRTNTKTHDFFSTKGNGYIKPMKVEPLQDDDFA